MSSTQAQLVDLPDEEEKPKLKIFTPKFIILLILGLYFVSQNIYYYITKPVNTNPVKPPPEQKTWDQFFQLMDRFQSYFILSVVAFCIFYYLRRQNDKYQQAQFLLQKQKQQKIQEEQRRKQAEREEKIIRKLEQEEKQAEQKQMKMSQMNNKPNEHPQKKQQQLPSKKDKNV